MKDKEINAINVDDYMRDRKRAGAKSVRWGKNGAVYFKGFVKALYDAECYKYPRTFFSGFLFMGLKHYLR